MMNNLPNGWEIAKLEDVVDILDSRRVPINSKERETRQGPIPYYGATGQVGWIDDFLFDAELVLLGEDGAPFFDSAKQKAYVIRGKSWVNNHAHVLRAKNGIPNAYIKYYLDIVDYHGFVSGTTRHKLNQAAMRQIPIPVAPLDQQKRIVAEIEKQFSRLDKAVANLKRVKANLKRYKAAVLKAAVEGKLGDSLREQWRATTLGAVASQIRNGFSRKPDADRGVRIFRISAVRPLKLHLNDVRYLSGRTSDYTDFLVSPGDILFTRYNGNRDLVGVCAVVPDQCPPTVHPDKLIRVKVPDTTFLPRMLAILASAGESRAFLETRIRTTAGQSGISGGDLKSMPVSVPPLTDQLRIVSEIERRLSLTEELEAQVDANLKRAERMRQSILGKAFSGGLGMDIVDMPTISRHPNSARAR